jgi:predicted MPP superfamily phosphohydrolase
MTESPDAMPQVRSFAGHARGRLATVALLGNWEHRVGAVGQLARDTYRSAGVDLLVNGALNVDVGGARLALVGLDDPLGGTPDLRAARSSVVPGGYLEQPPEATPIRPSLLLAGHTHGGQIRIPLLPPLKPIGSGRFLDGWYHDTFAPLYVSRGVGTTGIPARFLCPAELPIFTLRPA